MRPVIIIGAPRSGTNMLRDVVCRLPGIGTWPCDEINAIWRHGNLSAESDEFSPSDATAKVRRFIRGAFDRLQRRRSLSRVAEKTCANSLRVGFVDAVIPEARYIFVVRDGRDAAASAMRRWVAPFELGYTLKKARFVPLRDVPYYSARLVSNRIRRLIAPDRRLASWGPRFPGMPAILEQNGLPAVCAAQWARCVDRAEQAFAELDSSRVHRVRYEDFVTSPADHMDRIADFLEVDVPRERIQRLVQMVTPNNVGKWKTQLTESDLGKVVEIAGSTLRTCGYE